MTHINVEDSYSTIEVLTLPSTTIEIINEEDSSVEILESTTDLVEIIEQGPQGPPGPSATTLNNPVFSYTDGLLTEIQYGGGEIKDLSYVDGILVTVLFDNLGTITTKTLNYTNGVLTSITEN